MLSPNDPGNGDMFGYSVDISDDGDTIVVGAPYNLNGGTGRGAAYVFLKGSSWGAMTESCKITASDTADHDNFGFSCAISGDASKVFISAPFDDDGATNVGAVYVYNRPSGSNWNTSSTLSTHRYKLLGPYGADTNMGNSRFGSCADTTGTVFVVGARYHSNSKGAVTTWRVTKPALEVDAMEVGAMEVDAMDVGAMDVTGNLTLSSTGAVKIPAGTTTQRPSNAVPGMLRFNTTLNATEIRTATGWGEIAANESLYSFTTHTFSNANKIGRYGPSLTECRNAYNVTWDTDTSLFNVVTQGIQRWTVPANGSYTITCKGASGGRFGSVHPHPGFPGGGATVTATFTLTMNTVLNIVVGQRPTTTGTNGWGASAGGGASWVYTGSIGGTNLLMVAGGGGGTGHGNGSGYAGNGKGGSSGTNSNEAGSGSWPTTVGSGSNARTGTGSSGNKGLGEGGRGTLPYINQYGGAAGGAGWNSDGNNDESNSHSSMNPGGGGGRFLGGAGGIPMAYTDGGFGGGGGSGGSVAAGGGGGGYTGGGAGSGWNNLSWGGGGGGGSYIDSQGTNTTWTAGDDAIDQTAIHNGYVTITKI